MNDFIYGLKKGIPIALGYFAVSFSFGVMAVSGGLSPLASIIISATNLTSSGQYAGVKLMLEFAPYFELLLTVLLINLRYSLMSISLSQRMTSIPVGLKLLIGFGITDEIYAVSITDSHKINAKYMFGLISLPFLAWILGTTTGAFGAGFFNKDLLAAMQISLYAMFIALILPDARKFKPIFLVIAIAILISVGFYYIPVIKEIGLGFKIIISTVVASIIGAIFFPIEDDKDEDPEPEIKAKEELNNDL